MPSPKLGRSVPPHDRHPVAWYQPDVLWTAAQQVLSSLDQLRNRDGREGQLLPLVVIDRSIPEDNGEFWFDFIADTGDGGNAVYAVANAALADELVLDGQRLPRGELLLLGGDLAYPAASTEDYRYRFVEMFEAVRNSFEPTRVRGRRLTLAAIPQNHDWMDSASTFNRYFTRGKDSAPLLGAKLPQRQTCFCVKLPQGWWALGLDFALDHDIDRDQYEQFEALLSDKGLTTDGRTQRIEPEDRVVLIYPEPYWTRPIGDGADASHPKRYQRLEGLLRGRVKLRLAGDLHHYMRWDSVSWGKIVTCGTGGAFSHPTHTKTTTRPVRLMEFDTSDCIPPEPFTSRPALAIGLTEDKHPGCEFERQEAAAYPDIETSRAGCKANLWALFRRDPSGGGGNAWFAVLLGALYWFNAYLNSMPFVDSFEPDGFKAMWRFDVTEFWHVFLLWLKAMVFSPLGFLMNLLMAFGCMVMGREAVDELSPADGRLWRWTVTWGIGFVHAWVHVLAVFTLEFLGHLFIGELSWIGNRTEPAGLILHSCLVGVGVFSVGGILGTFVFGAYLALMSRLGYLTNNGYAALDGQDHKGFLRFRIDRDGGLTAWFIALDRVPRRWKRNEAVTGPVWVADDEEATGARVRDSFSL